MTVFIPILRRYKFEVFISVIAGILSGVCFSGLVSTISEAIDTHLAHPELICLKFVVTWVGYGFFAVVSSHCIRQLSQQLVLDLRTGLTEKILTCPLAKVEKMGTQVLAVLTEDINALAHALEKAPGALSAFAIVLFCSIFYLSTSPILFCFIAILMTAFCLCFIRPLQKARRYREEVRKEWNIIFRYIHELNQGIKELLLNTTKKNIFLYEKLYPACRRQKEQTIYVNLIENLMSRLVDLILLLALGLAILILPNLGYASFQEIEKFLLLFLFASPSLKTTLTFSNAFRTVKVSLKQIEALDLSVSLGQEGANPQKAPSTQMLTDKFQTLSLTQLGYDYRERDHAFTLGPVSLEFWMPEIVFITGGNGSGKSTLVKLLCGLYSPSAGQISFNGQAITEANQDAYRQCFSVLFADGFLFKDLLSKQDADTTANVSKWNHYLNILGLSDKVRIENGQFSTVQLSVGQKKRLSLLVALMENPHIYIFDEWAANQDFTFKKFFYYQILPELKAKGKLVLVISHDEAYYDVADRVIKLESGYVISDTVKPCAA